MMQQLMLGFSSVYFKKHDYVLTEPNHESYRSPKLYKSINVILKSPIGLFSHMLFIHLLQRQFEKKGCSNLSIFSV